MNAGIQIFLFLKYLKKYKRTFQCIITERKKNFLRAYCDTDFADGEIKKKDPLQDIFFFVLGYSSKYHEN